MPDRSAILARKRMEEYYLALGRFVDQFAHVETAMFLCLAWYTKTKGVTAKTVFSSARIDVISNYLRRLSEVGIIDKEKMG